MMSQASYHFITRLTWFRVFYLALKYLHQPSRALRAFFMLGELRKKYSGDGSTKGFKANGRYFLYNQVPGFPSRAFDVYFKEELNIVEPFQPEIRMLRSVVLSITKRCPLNCEHCYEAELLNQKEKLSLEDLKRIVSALQDNGVTQIYLSGGEPMARFNDLLELLKSSRKGTDFWLVTSGINLTLEKAKLLKKTGRLTGVSVSLDHFLPAMHNAFRRKSNSYQEAINAVKNCREVNLAVGMAICTTRSFVQQENLIHYAELARSLGANFIQLQEPYAVGNYAGQDVTLDDHHLEILDSFYKEMNTKKGYQEMPIVIFHGYHQRRIGCFGGGNRYLYIDSDGDIHSCPYCRTKKANILTDSFKECLQKLEAKGCLSFEDAPKIKRAIKIVDHQPVEP